MSQTLKAQFKISRWDESTYQELKGGGKLSKASITQDYTGEIEGSSTLEYLMTYSSASEARFVGFERIKATLNKKSGSFIIQHNGIFKDGVASSTFEIVEGCGTGDLENLAGSGSFKAGVDGVADIELHLAD